MYYVSVTVSVSVATVGFSCEGVAAWEVGEGYMYSDKDCLNAYSRKYSN